MFPLLPGSPLIPRPILVDVVDFWHPATREEKEKNCLLNHLRTRFDLRLVSPGEKPEVLLYSRMKGSKQQRAYDCLKVFYTGECDRPRPRQADLSITFDPDDAGNVRLPYWRWHTGALEQLFTPWDVDAEISTKVDFCNFVYSNAAAKERIRFFHLLGRYKPVNAGGKLFNNVGGRVADKVAFLRRHKFTIAFENQSCAGYTTEKMTEALAARTVPIYWGDPQAARDFNPRAFINAHDFPSLDALAAHVEEVDNNDALYRRYLEAIATEPINGGLARIRDMDDRVFSAFKHLVENPPQPRASQRWQNRLLRGCWNLTHRR